MTNLNVLYTSMFTKVLFDRSGMTRKAGELPSLRSEILKFKTTVERKFVLPSSPGLFTLERHHLNHVLEDLERTESMQFTDVAPS